MPQPPAPLLLLLPLQALLPAWEAVWLAPEPLVFLDLDLDLDLGEPEPPATSSISARVKIRMVIS